MWVWIQGHALAALPTRRSPVGPSAVLVGPSAVWWAPVPSGGDPCRSGRMTNISPSLGFDPHIVHPLASRYTDSTIPATQTRIDLRGISYLYMYRSLFLAVIFRCVEFQWLEEQETKHIRNIINYHITNKCTNSMSFIFKSLFKTHSLLLHVSIVYCLSSSGSTYSS